MTPKATRACGLVPRLMLLAIAACGSAGAHELQENRATLVQREANFVAMTLYIDLPAVLHHALAPQRSFAEFAVAHANMPPDAFKAVLTRVATRMQSETQATTTKGRTLAFAHLARPSARTLAFAHWAWPDAPRVQEALRDRLMETVVAPTDPTHTAPLDVHAELHSDLPITALRVQFAPVLGRMMVVSYRPKQVWADSHRPSPAITF